MSRDLAWILTMACGMGCALCVILHWYGVAVIFAIGAARCLIDYAQAKAPADPEKN